jgi:glycosyltransferase involved in cell wall biosynthesis
MRAPRILFLDHSAELGGAELYLLDLARAYRSTSTVFLLDEGPFADRLRDESISIEVLPAEKSFLSVRKEGALYDQLRALPSIASLTLRLARQAREYDLIFANSQKALVVAALTRFLTGTPLIWNLHDVLTADHFSAFNRWIATRLANGCVNRVIVNSEATRNAFVASGGHRRKTALVYNGIDAAPFNAVTQEETQAARRALGVGVDVPLFGVFSRIAEWKGQHVIIQALSEIPEAHLVLVGDALFGEDQAYKQRLKALCVRHGLTDRVHFLGFRDDVPTLMAASDAVVHTSTAPEPFGRVIVEGMLARTPVVAAKAGGPLELIDEGQTGRLVSPGAPSELAEALQDLLGDEQATNDMVSRAYDRARSKFSKENMISAIHEQVRDVAST